MNDETKDFITYWLLTWGNDWTWGGNLNRDDQLNKICSGGRHQDGLELVGGARGIYSNGRGFFLEYRYEADRGYFYRLEPKMMERFKQERSYDAETNS